MHPFIHSCHGILIKWDNVQESAIKVQDKTSMEQK